MDLITNTQIPATAEITGKVGSLDRVQKVQTYEPDFNFGREGDKSNNCRVQRVGGGSLRKPPVTLANDFQIKVATPYNRHLHLISTFTQEMEDRDSEESGGNPRLLGGEVEGGSSSTSIIAEADLAIFETSEKDHSEDMTHKNIQKGISKNSEAEVSVRNIPPASKEPKHRKYGAPSKVESQKLDLPMFNLGTSTPQETTPRIHQEEGSVFESPKQNRRVAETVTE